MKRALTIVLAATAMLSTLLVACPSPKMPTGPSPEYEEPPRPSWLDAGAAPSPSPSPSPSPADAAAD